ncbi:MAG: eukaryotic-like serine/threonine-protein kinase, partial [Actinomycetota bacterium]|nr:eukaryotic-like serine/threonine-protein kinase [Actinomycetota bacterium]
FDARGRALWTSSTGNPGPSVPAVVDGVVYEGSGGGSQDGRLLAFDAQAASSNCTGTGTKICAPLWSATLAPAPFAVTSSPAVSNGVVYVGSQDGDLYALDAAGRVHCSGIPKLCAPLWHAVIGGQVLSSPAVANGVVYIGSTYRDGGDGLFAFDAAGKVNCGGTPTVCRPLWSAPTRGNVNATPAVANGVVYVGSDDGNLYAFDARGQQQCSGTPVVCSPMWRFPLLGTNVYTAAAVAYGTVYMASSSGELFALDAAGTRNCSGTPKICRPLWSAAVSPGLPLSSPSVADGVVYISSLDGHVYGFDARGRADCTGSPVSCAPVWSATGGLTPVISNGNVYVGTLNGLIYAYGHPSR